MLPDTKLSTEETMRRALNALYLAVPETVAKAVHAHVNELLLTINQLSLDLAEARQRHDDHCAMSCNQYD